MNFFRSLTFGLAVSTSLLHGAVLAPPGNVGLAFPSANNSLSSAAVSGASIGVDKYTGTAQVSIPLCNVGSKVLSIPISLDYMDGRGILVQEYATQVGLGWALNAGGSISRVVRGYPDEETNGYLGVGSGNGAPNWGSVVSTPAQAALQNGTYVATTFTTTISTANFVALEGENSNHAPTADGEPDLFSVKTPYFAFQFSFNASGKPIFSNYNGFKVISSGFMSNSSVSPSNPVNASFEVLDDKGNQYYFGNTTNSVEVSTDTLFGGQYVFPTTWYLTKIVTFNSQDIVKFTYQPAQNNDVTYNYSWTELTDNTTNTSTFLESTGKNIIQKPLYVQTISTSLGEADFTYAFDRQDDPNAGRLSQIVLKAFNPQTSSNSTTLETFALNYSYFNGSSGNSNLERLCLNSVNETGSSGPALTLATFGYNTSVNLPDRTQWVYDYWGYCTTVQSPTPTDLSSVNRNPNATMAQADILTSVTTALGGTWTLSYQLNDYLPSGATSNTSIGGLRVSQLAQTLPTGENYHKTYAYVTSSGTSSGQIYSPYFSALSYPFHPADVTTLYLSNSPYVTNDVNGIFVGYSYVQETDQDKGYTLYNFTNFNDFSDGNFASVNNPNTTAILIPSTSLAYKRGLLKNSYVYSYNPTTLAYTLISQTTNNYTAQQTVTNDAFGFRPINFVEGANSQGPVIWTYWGLYSTPVENYLLTSTVQTTYDQINLANKMTTIVNYSYAVNATTNSALLSGSNSTDSKMQSHTQSFFHPNDGASIPMVTAGSAEAQTLVGMVGANCINVPVHMTDSRNSIVHQTHNTYAQFPLALATNVYPVSTSLYTGTTLESKQIFNYDAATSQLVSSNVTPGKPISAVYGYNSSYPLVKVVNASNTATTVNQITSGGGAFTFTSSNWVGQQANFTLNSVGSITLAMPQGLSGGYNETFSFNLQGPMPETGGLCYTTSSTNACQFNSSYTFTNMPAGTYTVIVAPTGSDQPGNLYVTYNWQGFQEVASGAAEFFFEGFEQNASATPGSAHTGNMYYNSSYSVPYTPPNSRKYLIQWWSLSGGQWVFNQMPYTANMTLAAPLDDVRVFPVDALMTSYTYNPLVGKTSETDPSGKSQTFQYDGMGRLLRVLDQNGNILNQYDYEIQVPLHQ